MMDVVLCGFDIFVVIYVINFDMLKYIEEYVYCVGCIGCVGNKGDVMFFVGLKDWESFKWVEVFL